MNNIVTIGILIVGAVFTLIGYYSLEDTESGHYGPMTTTMITFFRMLIGIGVVLICLGIYQLTHWYETTKYINFKNIGHRCIAWFRACS